MKRIGMFLRLLEFTDNWKFAKTMPLDDFKMRPVLPDPSEFGRLSGNVLEDRNHRTPPAPSSSTSARQKSRAPESTASRTPIAKPDDLRITRPELVEEETEEQRDGLVKGLWVNIVRSGKAGKYIVAVEGETQEFAIEIPYQMGDRCRCDVIYKRGKVLSGKFKSWS
jgi:hypothetical protein